jgi:hypothetical protein
MKQLSLRGFDPELEKEIREIARKQGISLNRATICLLRKGAGLEEKSKSADVVGNSLDHLIGKWSDEEAKAFLKSIAPLEQVDRSFWK